MDKPSNEPNTFTYDSPHPIYAMAFSPSISSPLPPRVAACRRDRTKPPCDVLPPSTPTSLSLPSPSPSPSLRRTLTLDQAPLPSRPPPTPSSASLPHSLRPCATLTSPASISRSPLQQTASPGRLLRPADVFDWTRTGARSIVYLQHRQSPAPILGRRASRRRKPDFIAHDKEVYALPGARLGFFRLLFPRWSVSESLILRDKGHPSMCTRAQAPTNSRCLRIAWNKMDAEYMATI
ncbi:uncharacterized protein A4U43_C04F23440 [Asparagus officinalis]|uniref:Uncharacterized protein n=1 Tax=Asparagus officinalis TaxID=4686 RepID=A0A5P1F5W5_ASPOF|nr:uncharacterized protein A4U43_C04F23440 [Asparagus officinalis]